jgi:hypothetical protein
MRAPYQKLKESPSPEADVTANHAATLGGRMLNEFH